MAMLTLTCPITKHAVRTGVTVEGDPLPTETEPTTMVCPACGQRHTWSLVAGDVVVHDTSPASSPSP